MRFALREIPIHEYITGKGEELNDGKKIKVLAESINGGWIGRWNFLSDRIEMELENAAEPYRFLYEGTHGGKFSPRSDHWISSDGISRFQEKDWRMSIQQI